MKAHIPSVNKEAFLVLPTVLMIKRTKVLLVDISLQDIVIEIILDIKNIVQDPLFIKLLFNDLKLSIYSLKGQYC